MPAAFALLALVAIVGIASRRPRADPDALWEQAEVSLRAGRFAEAEAALRRIDRLRPRAAPDWLLAAQVAIAAGRTDEAIAAAGQVPDADPLAAEARLLAGRLERQRYRLVPAEAAFRRALALDPGLVGARRELIYILGLQLRRRELDAEFRILGRLVPLGHHDLFTWAMSQFSSWSPDVAVDLQAAVDVDPEDRYSRLALAEALYDQPGEGDRARRLLDALPATDPEAQTLRVALAIHEGNFEAAVALLADSPADLPGLARWRGRLALFRKDAATAAAHFRVALGDGPYDRLSTAELGRALTLLDDHEAARPLLDRARRLDSLYDLIYRIRSPGRENEATDLIKIADACAAAGLVEESRHWYRLAIARNPLDTAAQAALYRLGRMDMR